MDEQYQAVVCNVLTEVLEEFAFIFVETEPDDQTELPDNTVCAEIVFSEKKTKGNLGIALSWTKCVELAGNLLGLDEEEDLTKRTIENALEELVNVVCGRLLAEIFGTEHVFDLSIPETKYLSKKKWQNLVKSKDTLLVYDEEEPIAIYLRRY